MRDVDLHGYYGGIRLVKATIKKFVEYCRGRHALHDRNFSIRYETNIPRQVGLAGSSAIIVATMRALMEFYQVAIPLDVQPSFVLSVEKDELGIAAGLQDRVVQVYGGLVYMDFSRECMVERNGLRCGRYEPLDPALLPPLVRGLQRGRGRADGSVSQQSAAPVRSGGTGGGRRDAAVCRLAQEARDALVQRQPERLGRADQSELRPASVDLPPAARTRADDRRRLAASGPAPSSPDRAGPSLARMTTTRCTADWSGSWVRSGAA